jgi:hypothetical protein
MNIDALTKKAVVDRLGALTLANIELQSTVAVLSEVIKQRDAEIADLKAQLVVLSGERDEARGRAACDVDRPVGQTENLPANPYGSETLQ